MLRFLLAALAAAAVPLAVAQPITPAGAGPQVELAAEASREVANDLMTATLFATAEGSDPAPLQGQINRAVSEALRVAAEFREVKARSGGSQTFPVYDRNNRQTGWRGRGEIRLEGRDFQQMAQLVARLQSTMQLGGLTFSLSPELRRQTENDLINEAVAAFRSRADITTRALGARTYRIKRLSINASSSFPVPRAMARMAPAAAPDAVATPTFEGGTSQVQVGAQGTVELE